MTIVSGERYKIETFSQFVEHTGFDLKDVAVAIENDNRYNYNILDKINEHHEEYGTFEIIRNAPEDVIQEEFDIANIETHEAIIATLDADNRKWVHLYDGTIHDIVELHI